MKLSLSQMGFQSIGNQRSKVHLPWRIHAELSASYVCERERERLTRYCFSVRLQFCLKTCASSNSFWFWKNKFIYFIFFFLISFIWSSIYIYFLLLLENCNFLVHIKHTCILTIECNLFSFTKFQCEYGPSKAKSPIKNTARPCKCPCHVIHRLS